MKFRQIIKKSYENYNGKVYDLTVEDSHSYNIENLVVHNSGGGALTSYAIGITKIDPLEYDLLFERFLNEKRGHLPDIDSDFCVEKGPQVFKYLIETYGKNHCCNIATFGRLQTKAVIKDLAKIMGIPFEEVNEFTRSLPSGPGNEIHIKDILEDPQYSEFVNKYPELFEHATLLEGSPRHVSQHAAGIAITPIPVTEILPVQNAKAIEGMEDGMTGYLSQFEKEWYNCSPMLEIA